MVLTERIVYRNELYCLLCCAHDFSCTVHVPLLFGWRVHCSFFFFKYIFWRFTVYSLLPVGITVLTVGVAPAIMSESWCRIGGAETKSRIAHFIAILLMNSCCSQIFSEAPIIYSPSKLVWNAHVQFKAVFNLTKVSSELCLTKRTIGRKRIILLYKLALLGFPLLLRKTVSSFVKYYDNFTFVWDHQSAAATSLALFSAINDNVN